MLQPNLFCRSRLDDQLRHVQCEKPFQGHPTDLTRIPVCPQALPPASTKNPFCGCPKTIDDCWDCYMPAAIETRVLRPPQMCIKPCCNYTIPAMSCQEPCKPKRELPCDPLCFDWTVDEPGPNDSYGLNGLNWHDWKMEEVTKNALHHVVKGFKPKHPGYAPAPPPPNTPVYIATQPLECYGAQPPCKREPFAMDVNYFRDWRCPEFRRQQPWKPPFAH
ncbi:unnamed protein product [Candidula unifasciata]|uniref:Uncharacterized protein n=1 Tax=Candidula unifasciata TaxID=100452 RepID=A0A8S3ZBP2_9EUPU|nr:unnamed protein product [Candidula unifasciata]